MVARFIKVCPNKQYIRTLTLHFIFRSFSFDLPNRKHYSSNTRVQFFDVKHMILLILSDHHFLMIHDLRLRNHLYIHFHVIITLEIDVHSRFNFMFFVIYIFLKKRCHFLHQLGRYPGQVERFVACASRHDIERPHRQVLNLAPKSGVT